MKSMAILKCGNLTPTHELRSMAGKPGLGPGRSAAVAPERVMQNLNQAIRRRGFAGLMNFALSGNSWSQSMRMRLDAINNSWNQWVLNYNQQTQKKFSQFLRI